MPHDGEHDEIHELKHRGDWERGAWFFFSSRRRHTRFSRDWSSDVCSSDLEQLGELRVRLEGKDRAVPFGVEVMGRVREIGSLDDVIEISRRTGWVRPVLDFAHMHATSDGAYTEAEPFREALEAADDVLPPRAPFHIHFSDIAYANRNETKHLPYGEGTLRAEPLRQALRKFRRPATVISESPDLASDQAIHAALS